MTMRTIEQLMDLTGRKALVVGGAGHIGSAICGALHEMNAVIAVLDMAAGKNPLSFVCDIRDEEGLRLVAQKAITEMGGLDILVHCAAYIGKEKIPGWSVPFERQTVIAWDDAMRVNLTSAFVLSQECKTALEQSGHGSIILFSSIYGMVGPDFRMYEGTHMINPAAYLASKGGMLQLMRYLATFFAPKIRVNAVSPGGVARDYPEIFNERYRSRVPLGRQASEEDLKGAAAYLASDLSTYVTGHNLVVDGGWTAW